MSCAIDSSLKQRTGNSLFHCIQTLIIACSLTNTNMCNAFIFHNGTDICKVQIDHRSLVDQVCNTLNTLLQHFIRLLQRLRHGGSAVTDCQQLVIRDNNQSIHYFFQFFHTGQCIVHADFSFKSKWLGNNTNS